MPRSARVESSDAEEERKAEPVTATLNAVTGLEDPAISEDALARAEASRRAYEVRKERRSPRSLLGLALSRGTMGTRRKTAKARTSMFVQEDGGSFLSLDDWLARPRVMRALQMAITCNFLPAARRAVRAKSFEAMPFYVAFRCV